MDERDLIKLIGIAVLPAVVFGWWLRGKLKRRRLWLRGLDWDQE